MEMGFPREEVVRAMRVTANNPDHAAELLLTGTLAEVSHCDSYSLLGS
jgi:UV excision repair protein RAD23